MDALDVAYAKIASTFNYFYDHPAAVYAAVVLLAYAVFRYRAQTHQKTASFDTLIELLVGLASIGTGVYALIRPWQMADASPLDFNAFLMYGIVAVHRGITAFQEAFKEVTPQAKLDPILPDSSAFEPVIAKEGDRANLHGE